MKKRIYKELSCSIKEVSDTMNNTLKILLTLLGVSSAFLSGCDEKKDLYKKLDTEKAEKAALEYMSEKYDQTFSIVSSKKNYEAGYAPTSIHAYWCDVELKIEDSEDDKSYTVRTTLNDDEEYIIEWDNYMNTLVTPLIKKDFEIIISKSGISECSINIYDIFEENINGCKGFSPDFDIFTEKDSLNSIIDKNDLWVCLTISIPNSIYKDNLGSEIEENLKEYFSQSFSDDYIRVSIFSYNDSEYPIVKKMIEEGNTQDNSMPKEIHYEDIILN